MKEIASALKRINFSDLIQLDHKDPANYSIAEYRRSGSHHPNILKYCTACEEGGINNATDGSGLALKNISHGAHSEDFISALERSPAINIWHNQPVLFVFETPSTNYGNLYQTVQIGLYTKRPAQEWYWVHGAHPCRGYPDSFAGGRYGDLVRSVILTFRLSNAYVTNLVKCGMNDPEGKRFVGIGAFPENCIRTCFKNFLSREIDVLQPRVVFAFGSAVEQWLIRLLPQGTPIQQIPHPAGRRRGFRDQYYEALYFWLIARALVRTEIITEDLALELGRAFLRTAEISL